MRDIPRGHFVDKCVHGVVVRQCRCVGPKEVRLVGCSCPETYHGRHRRADRARNPEMRTVMQTIAVSTP